MIVKSLLLIVHFCVHAIVLFSTKQNFPIISNDTLSIYILIFFADAAQDSQRVAEVLKETLHTQQQW